VLIELTDQISFTWNNSLQKVEEDADYENIKKHFLIYRETIVNQILNTEKTDARICETDRDVSKGIMAFVLLDHVAPIPYLSGLNMQFCTFTDGCSFPDGLIFYVSNNRKKVIKDIRVYYGMKD
jgi:hypothetical protein